MTQAGTRALSASDASLTSSTSSSITISHAAASKLIIAQQPNSAMAGQSVGTVIVEIEDQYGNIATGNSATVALAGVSLTGTTSVAAVNGVATFTGLSMTQVGTQTLTATSAGLTLAVSNSITISPAAASKLVFTTQPTNAIAGSGIGTVAVSIEDAYGNVLTNNTSTVTLAGTSLTGTTSVAAVNGVATFTGLSMTQAGTRTLLASDGSLTSAISNSITITPASVTPVPLGQFNFSGDTGVETADAPAYQAPSVVVGSISRGSGLLANNQGYPAAFGNSISSVPVGYVYSATIAQAQSLNQFYQFTVSAAAGQALSLSTLGFAAWAQLASGTFAAGLAYSINGVNFTTVPLTGSLTSASATTPASVTANLSGISALQNTSATVTLRIYLIGAGAYQSSGLGQTKSASDLSVTGSLTPQTQPGVPTQLAFVQQPSASATAGQNIGTVIVDVTDAYGNVAAGNNSAVTLAGNSLSGTLTQTAVNGVATFTGLSMTRSGAYTLSATDGALTPATSSSITISPAAASTLVFTTQPSGAVAGASIGTVAVTLDDAYGNTVTGNTSTVTLSGNGLTGTTSVAAVNGVATFTGLSMTQIGSFMLSATDGTLALSTSSSITISPATASTLVFTTQPAGAAAGTSIGTVTVSVEDAYGNVIIGNTSTVKLSGTGLTGTTAVAAINGVATFTGLSMTQSGAYALSATDGTLTPATSSSITISPAAASKLVFTTQPSNSSAGASIGTVTVAVEDVYGNVVTGNSSNVTLSATGLTGTTSVAAVNGMATFTGLSMAQTGSFALSAADNSLTPATSNSITISAASATPVPLGQFNFSGNTGVETSDAAAYQATNVTVGSISRGSGSQANNQGYPGAFGNSICSIPVGWSYPTTIAQAQSMNQYYQFTVSAAPGHTLSLSTLGFAAWAQLASSSFAAGLAYSTDGVNFTNVSLTGSLTSASAGAPGTATANLSGISALQNTSATITFRIYLIGAGAYQDTGLGQTHSTNDLFINGNLTS
jgi:hypothetical protein